MYVLSCEGVSYGRSEKNSYQHTYIFNLTVSSNMIEQFVVKMEIEIISFIIEKFRCIVEVVLVCKRAKIEPF